MKLLHIIRSLDPRDGGVVGLTRDLVLAGRQTGDDAEVCVLDSPNSPWLSQWTTPVHALGPAMGTYGFTPRLIPWVRANASHYDGVILHGLWQFSTFGSWMALKKGPLAPHIVFPHGMLDSWFKTHLPGKHFKKALYWKLEYRVLQAARAVCFTAEEELNHSRETFHPFDCNPIVVGAGIEPPPDSLESRSTAFFSHFPKLGGHRFVLFLGRLHLKKGCDLFVRAFEQAAAHHPELHAVLAGPDPDGMEPELRAILPAALQNRLHFTGMLEGDLKWAAIRAADCLMIPSHQENFCLAVAEALACGTPVLISNRVNIWREVTESGSGYVQPDTEEGICDLLRQWETTPLTQQDLMRRRARDCFTRHFSIDRVYANVRALFAPH